MLPPFKNPDMNELSYRVPFTSNSNLAAGFHVSAALGGGVPHSFVVDTGSVGILVPRQTLGPEYQSFDPSLDIEFQYISSGNVYHGQWVKVLVIIGVPAAWDGSGDYPTANVEVFAVDRPADFDGGVFGIGFAIGGLADGGPERNPLLHLSYQGRPLSRGYIISTEGIDAGLTEANRQGFGFIPLDRDSSGKDWRQPLASVSLTGIFSTNGFLAHLPLLMDTGVEEMILWLKADNVPPDLPSHTAFPAGILIAVKAPPASDGIQPVLEYSFVTGDTGQSAIPTNVEWRTGNGINTGRTVLGRISYVYDADLGRMGFRPLT